MKAKKVLGWLFGATTLIFSLVACQAATPTSLPTETAAPTMDLSSLGMSTPLPTLAPVVLEGATTTESGLQYLELVAGDGAAPKSGDIVTMHYIVSLGDGTELYSTYTEDQPSNIVWGRGSLLPGWEEGVGLMKVGGKGKFVLPPELAFGAEGTNMIPPNSQLVMEIEILATKAAPKPTKVDSAKLKKSDNGLQYYDMKLGTGTEAISTTTVTTEFTLWVKGETEDTYIGSSDDSEPITFVVGRGDIVFPGWENGVVGMKVGGKRYLIVPPDLGMGAYSSGDIPANSTLIMEISLTEVVEPRKPTEVDEKDYVTTDSGLKYYDIEVGTGVTPTVGQTVVVNYTGWLLDGTQFDSSLDSGQPFSFQLGVGSVIRGWDEGVAGMKVGGKRQLLIPPELGYGESGAGATIPPGATLIFDVELVEIQP